MKLGENDKISIVKAFTEINKIRKGRGPKNIYLKQDKNGIHVISEGILTEFEKYLISTYGEQETHYFFSLYQKDIKNVERAFLEIIDYNHDLYVEQLDCDFINDRFTYLLKFNDINDSLDKQWITY